MSKARTRRHFHHRQRTQSSKENESVLCASLVKFPAASLAVPVTVERHAEKLQSTQIPKLEPQIPPISQILRRFLEDDRTNLFVAKLEGVANRNLTYLLYLRNLRNLWLNPFRFLG
jgi:hypothetical protein